MEPPNPDDLRIHENAEQYFDATRRRLGASILALARGKALQEGADEIQTSHMKHAEMLLGESLGRSRLRELAVIVGSLLAGASLSGFIQELSGEKRTGVLSLYFAMGPIGLVITFWGLRK